MELCATIMSPYKEMNKNLIEQIQGEKPQGLEQLVNSMTIMNFINKEGPLNFTLMNDILKNLSLESQQDKIIVIQDLPTNWSQEEIK